MYKFKVGNKVRYTNGQAFSNDKYAVFIKDITNTAIWFEHNTNVSIRAAYDSASSSHLTLVEGDLVPHKHHDVIIAWAKGETIQTRKDKDPWYDVPRNQPRWMDHQDYRVKPKEPTQREKILESIAELQSKMDILKQQADDLGDN